MTKTRTQAAVENAVPQKITVRVGQTANASGVFSGIPQDIDHNDYDMINVVTNYDNLKTNMSGVTVAQILELMSKVASNFPEYTNVRLALEKNCSCYYDCTCLPSLICVGDRMETDAEAKVRTRIEIRRQQLQRKHMEEQYRELSKALGKTHE